MVVDEESNVSMELLQILASSQQCPAHDSDSIWHVTSSEYTKLSRVCWCMLDQEKR